MNTKVIVGTVSFVVIGVILLEGTRALSKEGAKPMSSASQAQPFPLPQPKHDGDMSVEKAIFNRRSVREFSDQPLTLAQLSQLMWAAQGITGSGYLRSAPSAGALYPLEVYIAVGKVTGLEPGIYKYKLNKHELTRVASGDRRADLAAAALGQSAVREAPVVMIFTVVYERTAAKYGPRAMRYVHVEVGHAAQNVSLQATALGLGSVPIGAFDDNRVKELLGNPPREEPLYIYPIGHK
jgi:SagB-type dehydrogenase family enzyme